MYYAEKLNQNWFCILPQMLINQDDIWRLILTKPELNYSKNIDFPIINVIYYDKWIVWKYEEVDLIDENLSQALVNLPYSGEWLMTLQTKATAAPDEDYITVYNDFLKIIFNEINLTVYTG